jgi:DNA repair exonuclease SbcCD ATPase subunit
MTQEQLLIKQLGRIRARIRALFALNGIGRLLMLVPPAMLLAIVMDYLLPGHFPAALRAVLLLGLIALAGFVLLVHLVRPLRTRIGVEDVALELEGYFPQLDDRLATTVNFIGDGPRGGESPALRQAVVQDTIQSVRSVEFTSALRPWPLVAIFLAGLLIAGGIAGLGIANSEEAGIGLERLLNPFTDRQWPQRTHLVVRDPEAVIPLGEDHDVMVELAPGSEVPGRVVLHHREVGADSWETQVMDDRRTAAGEPYFVQAFPQVRGSFEYYVTGGDDRQPAEGYYRVDARPRPRIERIILFITPPDYTRAATEAVPGEGATPALQGSTIAMHVITNKSIQGSDGLPRATLMLGSESIPMTFVESGQTFREGTSVLVADYEARKDDHSYLRAEFKLDDSRDFDFSLFCVDGFENHRLESRHHLRAEADKAPRISFTKPRDLTVDVTPRSVVELDALCEDDWGVSGTAFGYQRGQNKEKVVESLMQYDPAPETDSCPKSGSWQRRWDLTTFDPPLTEGEEVEFAGMAVDNFALNGQSPHTATTPTYRLRVISTQAKKDDLARQLPGLAMKVQDLVERQERLQTQTKDTKAGKADDKRLSDRGREQTVEQEGSERELQQTAKNLVEDFQNFLDEWRIHRIPQDEAFELGKGIQESLDEVSKDDPKGAMPKAADELRAARDAQAKAEEQGKSLDQSIEEMQKVIDTLRNSLGKLDRFNKAEQLAQEFKGLLDRQRRTTGDTKEQAARTLGKNQNELSGDERDQQDTLQRTQEQLGTETKAAVRKIQQASDELKESDPAVSQALKDAHEEAENRDPAKKMGNAAKDISENQAAGAKPSQEAAEEDLARIIDKLQDRTLAELKNRIEELKKLKGEAAALRAREQGHLGDNKAAQQQQPNSKNDQKLSEEQKKTQEDTQKLAEKMEAAQAGNATQSTQQASQSMGKASKGLGQSQKQDAEKDQQEAIDKLKEAEDELDKEIDEAEKEKQEEQLEKMKEKLARIRDGEVLVNKDTTDLETKKQASGRLERSDRNLLVTNQQKQNELLTDTGKVVAELEEAGVKVFRYALVRVTDRMAESHERLMASQTDQTTQVAQKQAISILSQLITALEDEVAARKKKKGGGGGGGGGGGKPELVPSLAELKMLRTMQQEVNQATESIDTSVKKSEKMTPEAEAETKRVGRDQDTLKNLMKSLTDPAAGGAKGDQT